MTHTVGIQLSVLIPTTGRAEYLEHALRSVRAQHDGEIVIVIDGPPIDVGHGARVEALGSPQGINVARNRAATLATGELLAFLDDDVEVWPLWREALLAAAESDPDAGCFAGPIRPRLEGPAPSGCGRPQDAAVTALDRDIGFGWGANFAITRAAFEAVGTFDEAINHCGDEEDWQRRLKRQGGRVRYVAGAGVDHRRAGEDARLRALARGAYHRGRAARAYDVRKGTAPPLRAELRVLVGMLFHVARHGCAAGVVPVARTLGRIRGATSP